MKEFTFNCATCGQPILASKDWDGQPMNCPSCETRLTITTSARAKKKTRITASATSRAKPAARSKRPPGFL